MFAQMSQEAMAGWAGVVVLVVSGVAGTAMASYRGAIKGTQKSIAGTQKSIRGVRRQLRKNSDTMSLNHLENQKAIVKLDEGQKNLSQQFSDVADGKTAHIAKITTRLDNHDDQLEELWQKKADVDACSGRHEDLRRLIREKENDKK